MVKSDRNQTREIILDIMKHYIEHSGYYMYTNRIVNSIARYLVSRDIYSESSILSTIRSVINGDIYIRGIGDTFKYILNEFIKYYEKDKY